MPYSRMPDSFKHVYLSPHLDDAALSCGGLIHRQARAGQSPLIVTVFAGRPSGNLDLSPFAKYQHTSWGSSEDVIVARWTEDRAAMSVLGADYLRLDYLDCIYRGKEHGNEPVWYYASEDAIFGPVHPAEQSFPAELTTVLSKLIPSSQDVTLYVPLTVGNHVDHQLTFFSALGLTAQVRQVLFYEDYPYVEEKGKLDAALIARGMEQWHATVMPVDEEDLAAKIGAITCYESQLGVLFGSAEAMSDRVIDFVSHVGGERVWQPDQAIVMLN
jgi:LmbE family N-acetylglucosaminyl deacetylase